MRHQRSPFAPLPKMEPPKYGEPIQYAKIDDSPSLALDLIKFIQKVTGKFLFYGRAIDNTMQHALNEIACSKDNETKHEATIYFLNYAASNPDAEIIFRASDMILQIDSDAAYLVCPKARSRAGGYHYIGNEDKKLFNGPVLVLAKVIKNVMSSAAEAEVAALFMNAQEAIPIRHCLIDLGHPQPPTPLKTDNSTAKGILTGEMKQKHTKAMDMRFYWLVNRVKQGHFQIYWEPGKNNLADYPTKHHSPAHHKRVRPIYLYNPETSPSDIQGCVKLLQSADIRKTKVEPTGRTKILPTVSTGKSLNIRALKLTSKLKISNTKRTSLKRIQLISIQNNKITLQRLQ
jgi:hypothetical protein